MDLIDKIELYQKFPGSLAARLKDRGGAEADEVSLGAFVQDVVEDVVYVENGELRASDRETYTIVWHPKPRSEWVEWDQVCAERRVKGGE